MWSSNGGSVNIFGKVFGTDGGTNADNRYSMYSINNNPQKVFSVPIMAGFLGKNKLNL